MSSPVRGADVRDISFRAAAFDNGVRGSLLLSATGSRWVRCCPFDDEDRQRMRTVDSTFSEGDDRSN